MGEQILVISAETLAANGIAGSSGTTGYFGQSHEIDKLLQPENLSFRDRDTLEDDPSWKQIIPYVVLVGSGCCDPVFVYRRGKAGAEGRLHGKLSIGLGGHVNITDREPPRCLPLGTTINRPNPIIHAVMRELMEEVEIISTYRTSLPVGLLYDPSTPVGSVHLGVVYITQLEHGHIRPLEPEIAEAGFVPLAWTRDNFDEFEDWSKLLLTYMHQRQADRQMRREAYPAAQLLL